MRRNRSKDSPSSSKITLDSAQRPSPPPATHRTHTTKAAPQGTSYTQTHQHLANDHKTLRNKKENLTHHRLGNAPVISFPNCDKKISSLFSCSGPLYMWKSFLYSDSLVLFPMSQVKVAREKIEQERHRPYLFKRLLNNRLPSRLPQTLV